MKSKAVIANHPIHPMLVPIPIGAFFIALIGDMLHTLRPEDPFWYELSFTCIGIGLIFALTAAVFGAIDYLGVKMSSRAFRLATWHAVLNLCLALAYAASFLLRRHTCRAPALPLARGFRLRSGRLRAPLCFRMARRQARLRAPRRSSRRAARSGRAPGLGARGLVKSGASPRPKRKSGGVGAFFEHLAHAAIEWAGGSWAFGIAVVVIVTWALTGPIFGFSDTWQLVINTGTTIVTFLMVFLIQRAQNKESKAIQLKLNEIVAAIQGASNHLIDVEDLSEGRSKRCAGTTGSWRGSRGRAGSVLESHSIEEARDRAEAKHKTVRRRTAGA